MLFKDILRDFESYLEHEKNLTVGSRKSYHFWLHKFSKWADEAKVSDDFALRFTTTVLRKYQYALSQGKRRPRTIINALQILRSLGDWAVMMDIVKENPVRALTMPKKDAANRPLASDNDLAKLLDASGRQADSMKSARDRAIISVLVYCGVRYQELLDIRVQDISLHAKTLLIASGKGRKPRQLFPNDTCMAALAEWLRVRAEIAPRFDWLWMCDVRRRMGVNGVRAMLEDTKIRAGLPPHAVVAPHSIRRAYATRCLKNGMDLRSLSASLGHSQASTTLIYTFYSERPAEAMRDHADLRNVDNTPSPPSKLETAFTSKPTPADAKPTRAALIQNQRRRTPSK